MNFDRVEIGDVAVIRVKEKKLTSAEAPEMKTALLGLVLEEHEKILINLAEVEYMDSTGLGSFLFGIRQAQQHAKQMEFCALQPRIQFLIRIAHLEDVMRVHKTEKEALKKMK
jgi:anti-sigma B factor antagonist